MGWTAEWSPINLNKRYREKGQRTGVLGSHQGTIFAVYTQKKERIKMGALWFFASDT